MIELSNEEMRCLELLSEDSVDVCLRSAIEGRMGKGWVDCKSNPAIGLVIVADFCYILGNLKGPEDANDIKELLSKAKGKIIKAKDLNWIAVLEEHFPDSLKRFNRYAIKRNSAGFHKDILNNYISRVESLYSITRIDEKLYYKVLDDPFMADCCCFFRSLEDFLENGRGYVVIHNDEIIAGASSYSYCKGYIDITIGTKNEYRQKGLAKAVAAKLILECLENNIYPVWDSVDMRSVALAEKLGYTFDKEYEVYMI